jgi:hypothetical protein
MTTTGTQTSSNAKADLTRALELALADLRAAQAAETSEQAKGHAEAAVNILVGKFGRWYGDGDGDGVRNDPSDGRGVLPGEIVPQGGADVDNATGFPRGLALLAGGTDPDAPLLTALLGDARLWRTKPRAGYDAIEEAVKNAGASPALGGLKGNVPRAVAFGRLILTRAGTMDEVKAWAAEGAVELEAAVAESG